MNPNTNNTSQEVFETIERYLANAMTEGELSTFEAQLKTNKELAVKVEEHRLLFNAIETQSLKEKMAVFHNNLLTETSVESTSTKVRFLQLRKLVAAAVVVIAVGSFWFFSGNSNTKLYNKYFSPDPGLPTAMSNTSNFEFYDAMVNYKQGDYKIAIDKWESLKTSSDTITYFIGVAHLANKNEDKAIDYLETLTKSNDFSMINDANYYLGMAYLKSGNVELAKKYLNFSKVDNSKQILLELKD